jgi:dihydrofolate reductase
MNNETARQSSIITLIVAMDLDRIIGVDNDLPWHIPADLRFFKQRTVGKPMIMGRRAHAAIGRPLPGRTSIVMSRNPAYRAPGCLVAHDPEQALALAGNAPEIMVIGGADIYAAFLPLAQRLDITLVKTRFQGDTWFPAFEAADWVLVASEDLDVGPQTPWPISIREYQRRQCPAGDATAPA